MQLASPTGTCQTIQIRQDLNVFSSQYRRVIVLPSPADSAPALNLPAMEVRGKKKKMIFQPTNAKALLFNWHTFYLKLWGNLTLME